MIQTKGFATIGYRQKSTHFLHLDIPLLVGLLILIMLGLIVLYSASGQNWAVLNKQVSRFILALSIMLVLAQIPPRWYRTFAPYIFSIGLFLLITVLLIGYIGKGAQRWLNLGIVKFQPSELMKLAVPCMIAAYLHERPLPPHYKEITFLLGLIFLPALLIAKQPDLGTALIIVASGLFVLFLANLPWRLIIGFMTTASLSLPVLWHFMHDYQRQRVLTFLNPERDPLGSGYHIIQSKIAIGSGGLFGKGWLNGTQSHLEFLPERSTDFIFAVLGEEFGFIGAAILLTAYLYIVARGLYISVKAQDTFSRLFSGSITLTFFVYAFVNIGMVSGLLPVVGLPLPLVSYGGTSMVTVLAGFGMLMSTHTHRKLLSN